MRYPFLTIYTDKLPADVGGCANGPAVRIKTKYRADTGIHAHEAEHVRQWYMGALIDVLAAFMLAYIPELARTASSCAITRTTAAGCSPDLLRRATGWRLRLAMRLRRSWVKDLVMFKNVADSC